MPSASQLDVDTIVAIATPPGRGGIGIVRLSGPASLAITRRLIMLPERPVRRHAHYGAVLDVHGRRIDDALVTWFQAPHSYTGEDVVEIGTHGSPVVLHAVVDLAVGYGARLARPGEFTERAFLVGRLNLAEAEAVNDVIHAQTLAQARLAAEQMGGALARELAPAKESLLHLIATLEAGIDFAEDDLETMADGEIAQRLGTLLEPLCRLEASFARNRPMRDGLKLAILGKPNTGKSSLFNRLLGRDRAIVTPIAGTTRDTLSEDLTLKDIPIRLVDTAGLRTTTDEVERLGVQRTWETAAEADLILHVLDAAAVPDGADEMGLPSFACPVLFVFNKCDLVPPEQRRQVLAAYCLRVGTRQDTASDTDHEVGEDSEPGEAIFTSAMTGEGLADLERRIVGAAGVAPTGTGMAMLTNSRQHAAMQATVEVLQAALTATADHTPHEMLLLSLHTALQSLNAITGETTSEEILNRIFSTFCIGK